MLTNLYTKRLAAAADNEDKAMINIKQPKLLIHVEFFSSYSGYKVIFVKILIFTKSVSGVYLFQLPIKFKTLIFFFIPY